ncbi:C-5 cytosine-specific DNA methylase [Marssonina coronariae]|uniref:C-5 cytosine-specific DNA methylase n=1 Tax=Diplocarpon coronariae TaxID=2795749 RepID=A0A218YX30_9HELO|nr:C-5 cytosine-specific DNA methylase [Marssonina coronariae]
MAPRKIKPKAGTGIEGAGEEEGKGRKKGGATTPAREELAERDAVVRDGEDEERSEDREEGKHFGGDEQDDTDRALSRAGGDPDGWFLLARAR